MSKSKYKTKIVGKIDKSFCKKNNIKQYSNLKIEQSLGLIYHVQKHMNDFKSVDSFNTTLSNIKKVIENPYYSMYDPRKKTLLDIKKLEEYVCIIVNLNENNAYVSTLYPVSKKNIDKLKKIKIK